MADGKLAAPTPLAALAKQGPRELALKTARDLERACRAELVPEKPFNVWHLTAARIEEMRRKPDDTSDAVIAEWTAWQLAYSTAIRNNTDRVRGALWCYRALRSVVAANQDDGEALDLGRLVRAFLREEWGIAEPPMDRFECDELARTTVERLAIVRTERDA